MENSKLSPSHCLLPWTSLEISVSGNIKPCCKLALPFKENDQFINVNDISLDQAWNSKPAKELRESFLRGEEPALCSNCWNEEKSGMLSLRQLENKNKDLMYLQDRHELEKLNSPLNLDFKLGSVCNLKCRICDPFHSSTWLSEYLTDESMKRNDNYKKYESYMTEENWMTLDKWFSNIKRMTFYGGEPLLQKDLYRILDTCIDSGYAGGIDLSINTNSTIFDERFLSYFEEFRWIDIMHSIDDIESRFEYQRHPANWKRTNEVLKKFSKARRKNVGLYIYTTVSVFNVYYLPELLEWTRKNYPKHPVFLNLVHYPSHFSIVNLPNKLKSEVSHRLKFINQKKYNLFDGNSIQAILAHLNNEASDEVFKSGVEEIKRADRFRGENFSKVFPEISQYFNG